MGYKEFKNPIDISFFCATILEKRNTKNKMKNKKIISFIALIISIFVHSVIFSVPAYLYYVQNNKLKNSNNTLEKNASQTYFIEASMLPDIKVIGDKSVVKKIKSETKEILKKEESGNNENKSGANSLYDEPDSEMLVIYDYIKRKIQENKKYPPQAKKEHIEGVVELQFAIDKNGFLKNVNIINSSGYKILDDEAISTINRSAPYPSIVGKVNSDRLDLQVKLIFKID